MAPKRLIRIDEIRPTPTRAPLVVRLVNHTTDGADHQASPAGGQLDVHSAGHQSSGVYPDGDQPIDPLPASTCATQYPSARRYTDPSPEPRRFVMAHRVNQVEPAPPDRL
jgi:hypothetical protein